MRQYTRSEIQEDLPKDCSATMLQNSLAESEVFVKYIGHVHWITAQGTRRVEKLVSFRRRVPLLKQSQ